MLHFSCNQLLNFINSHRFRVIFLGVTWIIFIITLIICLINSSKKNDIYAFGVFFLIVSVISNVIFGVISFVSPEYIEKIENNVGSDVYQVV